MADGYITIGTELDTKKFDAQIQQLERDLDQMEKSYSTGRKMGFKEDEEDLSRLEVEIEKTKNKLIQLKQQKDKASQPSNINGMSDAFKNVGNSIQTAIGKVGKLVLGIFAIRSAYMAVRRASSDLASYDSQYAANIEYIRYALTQMIAPVLRWIVSLAATVLKYINMIVNALFGVNLFSKGSAESFNKMKAGAGGVSKAVKEIKKQLLGFDEINVLTEQSDTGTQAGGGGVGGAVPDFDLSALDGEPPEWIKWIADNKDTILAAMAGIAAGLLAWKLGLGGIKSLGIGLAVAGIVKLIKDVIKFLKEPTWDNFKQILYDISLILGGFALIIGGSLGAAMAGIAIALAGIVTIIDGVIKYLKDPSWKNFKKILLGIAIVVGVVAVAFGAIPALITAIILLIAAIGLAVYKHWGEIKETLSKVGDWINNHVIKPIVNFFKDLWKNIKTGWQTFWDTLATAIDNVAIWVYNHVIKPIVDFFKDLWKNLKDGAKETWDKITEIYGVVKDWFKEKLVQPVKDLFSGLWNKFKDAGKTAWDTIKTVFGTVKTWFKEKLVQPVKDLFSSLWSKFKDGGKNAWEGVKNVFGKVKEWFADKFGKAWTAVKNVFSTGGKIFTGIKEGILSAFKKIVNAIIKGINKIVSIPFNGINNTLNKIKSIEILGMKPFDRLWGWNPISVPQIPLLKTGGIINMPNKGTMIGGMAIGGEAGREGVIPLTDQQAMAELGREIGRHVLINLTNITQMNGRVLGREMKQIQNEQDFAFNR